VTSDLTIGVAGRRIGLTETEKVVIEEYGQRIVPGRQTIICLGPSSIVLPLSLAEFAIAASSLVSLCALLWVCKRR
jgi:hypothetical protein